jgi:hypothetical protein
LRIAAPPDRREGEEGVHRFLPGESRQEAIRAADGAFFDNEVAARSCKTNNYGSSCP